MKKLWKKLVAVTTAVMMAVTLLPAMANAETTIDYNRKGSITINKTTNVEKKNTDGTNKEYEPLKVSSVFPLMFLTLVQIKNMNH